MIDVVNEVRNEVKSRCNTYAEKEGYDFWNDHIKYVVQNAVYLAKEYGADLEIVEIGALLHDIAQVSYVGPSEEHHILGAEIANQLLTRLGYSEDKIKLVQKCVLNHRGFKNLPRETIEEECVADADVMAHFDAIPSLFSLVYKTKQMNIEEGREYVRQKLERDYYKLSAKTREKLKERYNNIVMVLFGDK